MTSILMDARYLARHASGIGRYQRELVSEIQRLRPDLDFRFIVRARGDALPLRSSVELPFDHEPYGPYTSLLLGYLLSRAGPVDLFHSPFHVMPRRLACPAVLTLHDAFAFEQHKTSNQKPPVSWAEWGYFLWAIPDSVARARSILCVSQASADAIIQHVPKARSKIRVVYHGVTSSFRPIEDRDAVAQRCQQLLGSCEPFVLSVGGVSPNKNHVRMLRAFAAAFPFPSRVRLAVVTRFGNVAPLRTLARELGMSERYVCLGSPADADLVTLMNGAATLAFCSIAEGFGLPILEAMACGCPVITSNRSCIPEVAGDAALLCDPYDVREIADAMRRIVGEPNLRDELVALGFERARCFSWEKAARSTLEVYDECLSHA